MKTDDLHQALHELLGEPMSDAVLDDASEHVDAKVRRHRRRVGVAGAVLVVALATAITVGVVASRGRDKVGIATRPDAHPKLVPLHDVASFDALVVTPRDTALLTLEEVEQRLDDAEAVERYARIEPTAAMLSAYGSVKNDECGPLPRWAVKLEDADRLEELRTQLPAAEVVDRVQGAGRWPRIVEANGVGAPDAEVFMNVNASSAQIETVRALLERTPGVPTYRYLDKQDAYREFQRIFSGSPDLVSSTDPNVLPVSFRFDLAAGTDPASIRARFEHVDGVWRVVTPSAEVTQVPKLVAFPSQSDLPGSAGRRCPTAVVTPTTHP
jgi:hypothetical protein